LVTQIKPRREPGKGKEEKEQVAPVGVDEGRALSNPYLLRISLHNQTGPFIHPCKLAAAEKRGRKEQHR